MSPDEVNHSQAGNVFMLGAAGIFSKFPRTRPSQGRPVLAAGAIDSHVFNSRHIQLVHRTSSRRLLVHDRGYRYRCLVCWRQDL